MTERVALPEQVMSRIANSHRLTSPYTPGQFRMGHRMRIPTARVQTHATRHKATEVELPDGRKSPFFNAWRHPETHEMEPQ